MVVRVCERAAASGAAGVCVATDDERIRAAVERAGFRAVMTRPDHASGTDRIAEAAAALALPGEAIVVNVQGDEPLIDPALVRGVAELLSADRDAAMATAAHPIHDQSQFANPNVVKVVLDSRGHALYFSRAGIPFPRGSAPAPLRHVGLYAYRVEFLRRYAALPPAPIEQAESLEQLRALWHGHRIAVLVWPGEAAPGVDTPQDLETVRAVRTMSRKEP